MLIAGWEKNSFVDYPGKIAVVVFTPGCNLDCYYCHNRSLLIPEKNPELISEIDVFAYLEKRRGLLDAVVISGGEPTLQKDLAEFIGKVKEKGFLVKLDTNGTNPQVLKMLLKANLLDYIAMDFKAPFSKYKEICATDSFEAEIKASIKLLLEGKVAYEFRTTVVPELSEVDIWEMAQVIAGAHYYYLQQYRPPEFLPETREPHNPAFLRRAALRAAEWVNVCKTRGI
ncbi:MAG TPA: anaerobic ribonucleoside-triphosphate reductase activating protein [Clostridia bacterium]|nr:anaerobic ribonucleoside-triphosphate reductase activating protein [Clostridia bacterium]